MKVVEITKIFYTFLPFCLGYLLENNYSRDSMLTLMHSNCTSMHDPYFYTCIYVTSRS